MKNNHVSEVLFSLSEFQENVRQTRQKSDRIWDALEIVDHDEPGRPRPPSPRRQD